MTKNNIAITNDGSPTLFSEKFQAHYHSAHGALQESMHVFIEHGLTYFRTLHTDRTPCRILEFGLGTGLNALLTAQYASSKQVPIHYTSLEAYPISDDQHQQLNYGALVNAVDLFDSLYSTPWGIKTPVNPFFTFLKEETLFEDYAYGSGYHIIYYDAFAPTTQSHLWDEMMMKKCYDALESEGILVTFCAKGSFKRSLKAVGFEVEALPGPPGKREMTRAIKR